MSRSQRVRSRLFATDLGLGAQGPRFSGQELNHLAHERIHKQQHYTFNMQSLDTTVRIGNRFTHGGQLTGVRLNVHEDDAPSSTLTCDLLLNGVSIFPLSPKPTIAAGDDFGHIVIADGVGFGPDDKLQAQLIDTGGSTGPLQVRVEYLEAL